MFFISKYKKKGPPKVAVIIPMGTSVGLKINLAKVSAKVRNMAPDRALKGTRILLSGPTISLDTWGTIRPTKPIIPPTDTAVAVTKDPKTRMIFLMNSVLTPRCSATSSPVKIAFKSLENTYITKEPIIIIGAEKAMLFQLVRLNPPIVQKTILVNSSWFKSINRDIIAEIKALIAIPASNIVVIDTFDPVFDMV